MYMNILYFMLRFCFKHIDSFLIFCNFQKMNVRSVLSVIVPIVTALTRIDLGSSEYKKLSWFVHITDIHISKWEDQARVSDLKTFVTNVLAVIKPEFVMCGGDLTDAKANNPLVSDGQILWEWETYKNVTDSRWNHVPWLDLRGNHDNLDVLSRSSQHNYFANYSVMGREGHLKSYNKKFRSRGQQFNVVAIDATFELGMNYPFNFVGYLNEQDQDILNKIVTHMEEEEIPIFFGHYPTSVVKQSGYIRALISRGLVYLSGHLHDLAFFKMHNMYSFHNNTDLELELVDWKYHRKFRLLAVHQGKLSFVDVKFGDWPIVLVTYPKDTRIMMESKENYTNYQSNAISVLVFNITNIERIDISLDGGDALEAKRQGTGPLYLLTDWDSRKFTSGVHDLSVTVVSVDGSEKTVSQQFSLNPAEAKLLNNGLPNFVLRSSFTTLFQTLYLLTLLLNMTLAVGLKVIYHLAHTGRLPLRLRQIFLKCCRFCLFRKFVLVTSCDVIFYSLLGYVLYMAVGPWVIGSLVEGNIGAVFAWGVLVNKQLVEVQVPFAYYFVHCAIIHPAMVMVIGQILDYRNGLQGYLGHIVMSTLLLIMTVSSLLTSITFWMEYGVLGFILGPLKTWSYVFYSVMFLLAWRTGDKHLAEGYRRTVVLAAREKKNDDENPDATSSMLSN